MSDDETSSAEDEKMPDAKLMYSSGIVHFSQDPVTHEILEVELVEAWGKSTRRSRVRTLEYEDKGKPERGHLTYQERGLFVDNRGSVFELMETAEGDWWVVETERVSSNTDA